MTPEPHPEMQAVLLGAYAPCPSFAGACASMLWAPQLGHVPRGFAGATGTLDQVELVLVCAEPGDPHELESHTASFPVDALRSAHAHAYTCFQRGQDLFHRNVRLIMNLCLPGLDFHEQMKRTWITDSVLCSARVEGGAVPAAAAMACRSTYLERQLDLLSNAVVVALGGKASQRLKGVSRHVLTAVAAAPPGCNRRDARPSWNAVAEAVRAGRDK